MTHDQTIALGLFMFAAVSLRENTPFGLLRVVLYWILGNYFAGSFS